LTAKNVLKAEEPAWKKAFKNALLQEKKVRKEGREAQRQRQAEERKLKADVRRRKANADAVAAAGSGPAKPRTKGGSWPSEERTAKHNRTKFRSTSASTPADVAELSSKRPSRKSRAAEMGKVVKRGDQVSE
jgi:hypothetical protein